MHKKRDARNTGKAVSDCYAGEMTWKEYNEMEFDIIPLDFAEYPEIKEATKEYINKHFDKEDADRNGNYMIRGFIGDNLAAWYRDKEKLNLNYTAYGFYYFGFGFNDEKMLIYTWCEGDATITIFSDRAKQLNVCRKSPTFISLFVVQYIKPFPASGKAKHALPQMRKEERSKQCQIILEKRRRSWASG